MAELENLVLEHLRAIRGSIEPLDRKVERLEAKVESRFDHVEARIDELDTRVAGLTHAVVAAFGALGHRLDDHERRIARIDAERA
ncbi:hypothetical protein ACQVP2_18765 [Methylobacterium aquaticum]|uniref:hypothetical protein n=1 Tax=Methylobacterium aquaticum TaxID=270351 RepID=UPI003D172CF6